jgi:hypothetical protein
MLALFTAVLIASLLGSMHCAGMCGAFLLFAVSSSTPNASTPSRLSLLAAYNLGRLVTYTALGALAGAAGAALDLGGSMVGVQRAAAALAGAAMIVFGALAVLRAFGVRTPALPVPRTLQSTLTRAHRAIHAWSPLARAASVGLLTTLLPCGWLYAFVLTAAGTASPALGAGAMAAFWLGTLPVMLSLGAGLQALTGPLRARLPLITSLLLVAVGLYTLAGRLALPAFAGSAPAIASTTDAIDHVSRLDSDDAPCCKPAPASMP